MDAKQFVQELVAAFPAFGNPLDEQGVNGGDVVEFIDGTKYRELFAEAHSNIFAARLETLEADLRKQGFSVEILHNGALLIEQTGVLFCIGKRWDDDNGREIWETDVYTCTADNDRKALEYRTLCNYHESDKRVAEIVAAYVVEAASRFSAQLAASKPEEPAKVDPLDRALAELQSAQTQLAAFIENGRAKYAELIASLQKQIEDIKDYQLRSTATHFALRAPSGEWATFANGFETALISWENNRHEWPTAVPAEATRRAWSQKLGVELSIVPLNK